MSVLAAKRKESKFEVITYSVAIHDMLIELMQRGFGIKVPAADLKDRGYLLSGAKNRINQTAALLVNNVRAANSLYPTSLREFELRRDYQDRAVVCCEQLIGELQRIVDIFEVDINIYRRYVKALDREIELIKRWRQRENQRKSQFTGQPL